MSDKIFYDAIFGPGIYDLNSGMPFLLDDPIFGKLLPDDVKCLYTDIPLPSMSDEEE